MPYKNTNLKEHGASLRCRWAGVTQGDTFETVLPNDGGGVAASIQVTGTWGGATAGLEQSNDNLNWFPVKDSAGANIALTANGFVEFSASGVCFRPSLSGGTGSSLDFNVNFRG